MGKAAAVSATDRERYIGPAVLWVMVLAALLVAIYYDILFRLSVQWYVDPDYSHGFLVPVVAAYFVWERRARLGRLTPRPNWWGVSVLLLGLLMLGIGQVGAELFLQRSSLVVVLAGLVLLMMGRETLTVLSFPIAFLLFMVPLPAIV